MKIQKMYEPDDKLINIIELYGLDQYDRAKTYDRYIARHSGTERITPDNPTLHPIYYFNKNYYIYAREGETFKMLSKEIGNKSGKLFVFLNLLNKLIAREDHVEFDT